MISPEFRLIFSWSLEQVEKAKTNEELETVWKRFIEFRIYPGFVKAVKKRKEMINKIIT
ncbi:MAG: hypothetical protein RLY43_747 [Bacteroidota bacterium]|jgi:hypothetical protein